MKINLEPIKITRYPENEVKSHNIYAQKNGKNREVTFHKQGLFSKQIFGVFGECECGAVKGEGYCEHCQCRVVDRKNLPDYYIDLGFQIPKYNADFSNLGNLKSLICYEAILVTDDFGRYIININSEEDWSNLDVDALDNSNIYIGLEAARIIRPSIDEWAEKWLTDSILVPHPYFRPLIKKENGKYALAEVNTALQNILRKIKEYKGLMSCLDVNDKWAKILTVHHAQAVMDAYEGEHGCAREIYRLFCKGKNSFVHKTLRGHGIVNTVRGVCVNRFDVAEDIILVGDSFIEYLYPHLYEKYSGDLEAINKALIKNQEIVLVDRQPTIAANSIVAMLPRVASCYKFGTFTDGAIAHHEQADNKKQFDTLGIRTLGVNPIIMGGLAGDFDGDTLLVIPLYEKKNKELAKHMLASKSFINYANGEIRNTIPKDIECVA